MLGVTEVQSDSKNYCNMFKNILDTKIGRNTNSSRKKLLAGVKDAFSVLKWLQKFVMFIVIAYISNGL